MNDEITADHLVPRPDARLEALEARVRALEVVAGQHYRDDGAEAAMSDSGLVHLEARVVLELDWGNKERLPRGRRQA